MKLVLICTYIAFCLCFLSCQNEQKEIDELEDQYEIAVEKVRDIELFFSEMGNVKVKIEAPIMLRYKTADPYTEFPNGVKVIFYDDQLKERSTLTSKYAVNYEKKQEVFIRDSVVAITPEGDRIETEEMIWNEKSRRISGEKFVSVYTSRDTLYGRKGFDADQDFTQYSIKGFSGSKSIETQPKKK